MTDERPLTTLASALIDAERTRSHAAGEAADRIFARLETSIAALPPGGGEPGGNGGGSATGGVAPAVDGVRSLAKAKLGALLLGTFAAGIGVGAIGHVKLSATTPAVLATTTVPASAAPQPPAPTPPTASSPAHTPAATGLLPSTTVTASARAPVASARPDHDKDLSLAGERAWIERARMAMARGAQDDALVALDGHAREFPSGRMSEEREALAVHALAAQGKTDQAQARARAFRGRYPSSVFMPVVNRAAPGLEK